MRPGQISGKSVAELDVRTQFRYDTNPMRDRSYLARSNTLTTLIQCERNTTGQIQVLVPVNR